MHTQEDNESVSSIMCQTNEERMLTSLAGIRLSGMKSKLSNGKGRASRRQSQGSDEVWVRNSVDTNVVSAREEVGGMLARDRYEVGKGRKQGVKRASQSETLGWPQLHQAAAQHGVAQGRRG